MDFGQFSFMNPYSQNAGNTAPSTGQTNNPYAFGSGYGAPMGSPYAQNSMGGGFGMNNLMGGMGMMPMSQTANPYAFGTGYGMPMGNPYSMMGFGFGPMSMGQTSNPYAFGTGYGMQMGNPYAQNSPSYNQAQGDPYGPGFLQNLINSAPQQAVDPWGVNTAQSASPYQSAGVGSLAQRGITPAQPQAQPVASPYQTMGVGSLSQRLG